MNTHRRTATAVITCAAGLSLAACSVGITSARPGTSPSPSASRTGPLPTASSSHPPVVPFSRPALPSPATVAMVAVNAPIHSFPVPAGAHVSFNISCPKSIGLAVSPVTPAQSSAFYTTELPRAGYKIQDNFTMDGIVEFNFSGHGYTGSIATFADLGAEASANPSTVTLPSDLTKNVEEITMTAPGTPDTYMCPN
jgi:hypothetical protein